MREQRLVRTKATRINSTGLPDKPVVLNGRLPYAQLDQNRHPSGRADDQPDWGRTLGLSPFVRPYELHYR